MGFEPMIINFLFLKKDGALPIEQNGFSCKRWDSNPRSVKQQILSLPPLTARERLLYFIKVIFHNLCEL